MKIAFVVNPRSGGVDRLAELVERLRTRSGLGEVEVRVTEGTGDCSELAREAAAGGADLVVAAGGDGTVGGVVNGLRSDFPDLPVGVLPVGTGNDLARSLGVPLQVEGALEALARRKIRRIDLIRMEQGGRTRFAVNACAGGFTGEVDEELTDEIKATWGPMAFLRSALTTLPDVTDYETVLEFEGEDPVSFDTFNTVVANGRTAGAGIPVAPGALLDDGFLDVVVVISPENLRSLAGLAARILRGHHLDHPLVTCTRARTVSVVSRPGMWFNADGELQGKEPATFTVVPACLPVVVGREEAAALRPEGRSGR